MTTVAAPPAKPRVLELRQLNIPPELCKIDAWIGWKHILREGRWNKTPINLKTGALAKSDDPATWTSFKYALANYRRLGCDGIGLCRTEDLIFIDLDGVLDPAGNIREFPWAKPILETVKGRAYAERSVSGTGIHAVCRGTLPPGRREFDEPNLEHTGFGLYDTPRYFTFTGCVVPQSGPICDLTEELAKLHSELFPPKATSLNGISHHAPHAAVSIGLTDEELLEHARGLVLPSCVLDRA
jgi:putative DNA primase/helicase